MFVVRNCFYESENVLAEVDLVYDCEVQAVPELRGRARGKVELFACVQAEPSRYLFL